MGTNKYTQIIADQQIEVEQFELSKICNRPEEALVDLDRDRKSVV